MANVAAPKSIANTKNVNAKADKVLKWFKKNWK